MKMRCIFFLLVMIMFGLCADEGSSGDKPEKEYKTKENKSAELNSLMKKLYPLHTPLEAPQSGDWLYHHREPGETFQQYIQGNPITAKDRQRVIYIQPIGLFTTKQRENITLTAEYIGYYFGLSVKVPDDIPIGPDWPVNARRIHPSWGDEQLLTTYILDELLKPRLPADAAACLGLTAWDLWPGKGWNFVFGQASLRDRVGVWSIYRNGDPEKIFQLCLLRTLKTAVHEIGHMFSMQHCTAYECGMCGSNHREESDRRPLALCPECMAKVCWATGVEPIKRYQNLERFCRKNGLIDEAEFYKRLTAELGVKVKQR